MAIFIVNVIISFDIFLKVPYETKGSPPHNKNT